MFRPTRLLIPVLLGCLASPAWTGALLEPQPAPDWKVSRWINADPGKLSHNRGKVVVIEFFQLWCPGCNNFSLPLMRRWQEKYQDREDLMFVSIHSVFEGHELQKPEVLVRFIKERGITRAVGIDDYPKDGGTVPISMNRFDTGGTPHIVIVDKEGDLRFSHFGSFDPDPVEAFIERLLTETLDDKGGKSRSKTTPVDRSSGPKKKRTRPSTPPAAARTPAESENKTPPPVNKELSGTYKVTLEQTEKSCGELLKPQELIVELQVRGDQIDVRSVRPFLGIRKFTANFDESSGSVDTDAFEEVQQQGEAVRVKLQLSGNLAMSEDTPSVQFDFSVDQRGDDVSLDCYIEGKGTGGRVTRSSGG